MLLVLVADFSYQQQVSRESWELIKELTVLNSLGFS